jgi:hypothetical protein
MLASLYAEYMKTFDVPGWNCKGTFYLAETLNDYARSQVSPPYRNLLLSPPKVRIYIYFLHLEKYK